MNRIIIDFIEKQKVANICCLDGDNNPHCFSAIYVFDHNERRLYFKSGSSCNHSQYLARHKRVAGTIVPDKLNLFAIKGIQFTGTVIHDNIAINHHATTEYHKKNPIALAMPGEVWVIQLETIKMTDSTLGIGKKICWQREDLYEDIC